MKYFFSMFGSFLLAFCASSLEIFYAGKVPWMTLKIVNLLFTSETLKLKSNAVPLANMVFHLNWLWIWHKPAGGSNWACILAKLSLQIFLRNSLVRCWEKGKLCSYELQVKAVSSLLQLKDCVPAKQRLHHVTLGPILWSVSHRGPQCHRPQAADCRDKPDQVTCQEVVWVQHVRRQVGLNGSRRGWTAAVRSGEAVEGARRESRPLKRIPTTDRLAYSPLLPNENFTLLLEWSTLLC